MLRINNKKIDDGHVSSGSRISMMKEWDIHMIVQIS